jgi:hypothetical protein
MWNRFIAFLVGLNPFRRYFEYKIRLLEAQERIEAAARAEKAEERAAFLAAITSISQVSIEAARTSQAQAKALSTFLDSFKVTEAPQLREWDPEANDKRYLEKHYPEALKGLDKFDQFSLLIDKLNGDIE